VLLRASLVATVSTPTCQQPRLSVPPYTIQTKPAQIAPARQRGAADDEPATKRFCEMWTEEAPLARGSCTGTDRSTESVRRRH